MSDNEYSAKDIIVLSGPEGVRKRPAMYIGSTGSKGFLHLLYEVLDNAIDETQAGYAKNVMIKLTREEEVDVAEISDDGRGIPIDMIEKEGKPALEVIMTSLHSGAKFDNKAYKVAGGLHGVGLTVVNSLSEYTVVTVKRGGKTYRQTFSRGAILTPLEIIDTQNDGKTGTTVRFKPDLSIFSAKNFNSLEMKERLKELAFLNPGAHITLIDSRDAAGEVTTEYYSENGLIDFIDFVRGDKEALTKPIFIKKEADGIKVEIALQYVSTYSEELLSFVNKIRTPEGGTHVVGFHTAVTRAITSYMQKSMKKGKQSSADVEGDDTREGILAIVSILMQNPEFEGQTKEKLGNTFIKSVVDSSVYTEFARYLEENPADAQAIARKVMSSAEARESARRARDLARKKSMFEGSVLPGKLSDCTESDPEKAEIFIVEGESAAGSSKQGRDRMYQAILPLKGKILNVEKASDEKIFNNVELHAMVTAFGVGIRDSFKPDNIRYKKIILLTDADVDGSHIRTLLLTFIYRYMKALIERGNIYIAQPPLYKISKGRDHRYAYSDNEMNQILAGHDGKATIQRYKGLGEMNPDQLWETTMNPQNRVLKKINIKDGMIADALFSVLMGLDVEQRRKFLEEHSHEVSFLDI
ncbi:MAG TPA: DNA gyrase subunit B [Candidatus Baltobacteraceae bacterium]|nr:DNA gyrase subunit B [Candidatus Baltobacteraceae bacterium]